MPLLIINTSIDTLSQSTIEALHEEGRQILSVEIGKSIAYCMVMVNDGCSLSFGHEWNQSTAYLEVKNVGKLTPDLTLRLSAKLSPVDRRKFECTQRPDIHRIPRIRKASLGMEWGNLCQLAVI